jgi:putative ABC transport system permease protein
MDNLIIANTLHRPVRTIVSVLGVGLGVALLLLFTGLASGELRARAERDSKVGAEIIFRRSSGSSPFGLMGSALSLPVEYAERLAKVAGVEAVTPVGQYVQDQAGGIGFRAIEGIDFPSYSKITGIGIVAGAVPTSDDEVIVDAAHARNNRVQPGDRIEVLGKTFRIAGVYEPECGPRTKMSLSKLQSIYSASGRCSVVYVKCKNSAEQDAVAARILEAMPEGQIIFTRDIVRIYSESLPALDTFLRVIVGVALAVSTLTILLAMYTAVIERTREIGLLKSLGASKRWIVLTIEKEALLLSVLGILVGVLLSSLGKAAITRLTGMTVDIQLYWLLITATVGAAAGLVGALYPALRAARLDAVIALGYE